MRVVCDPQIPGEAVRRLAEAADLNQLVPFSATQERLDAARRAPSTNWFNVGFLTFGAAVFGFGVVASLVGGVVAEAVILTPFAVGFSIPGWRAWRELAASRRPAFPLKYHRRYVVPAADLDPEARKVWTRASRAAGTITGSEVVKEHDVDSVRVSVVLPDWLWEIAEKLALLSEVRAGQRAILSGLDAKAPEVAEVLGQQRRARDVAAADIERKVRQLEVLAGRVAEADDAVRKVRAARELTALNDSHADLLARTGHSGEADAHEAELLSRDLRAIIAQADEAVRQANEAASSLDPPDQ